MRAPRTSAGLWGTPAPQPVSRQEAVPTAKNGWAPAREAIPGADRAFLVAVESPREDALWDVADSLDELGALARTAGAVVAGKMSQRLDHPDPALYVGKGRANELAQLHAEDAYDLLIVDDELSATQLRNLERLTEARVIDRTALILDIFAQHARTREGQLQVELAQLEYRLPRLAGRGRVLSRIGGGSRGSGGGGVGGAIGVRGPGETKLEIDRRHIRTRIAELRRELTAVRRQRMLQRRQRKAQAIPVVALVGYTNAGKSTLFNALTAAGVLVEDKLFATLDPITRHLTLPTHQEVLLTDTVGFIQKLPTGLVAAFRATLEEVLEADVLLNVVDMTHENAIEQSETVDAVLEELGAAAKPRVTVLNKVDLLRDPAIADTSLFPNAVPVSAVSGAGLRELLLRLSDVIAAPMVPMRVLLSFDRGDLVEAFHRRGQVTYHRAEPTGTLMEGLVPRQLAAALAPFQAPRGSASAPASGAELPETLSASPAH